MVINSYSMSLSSKATKAMLIKSDNPLDIEKVKADAENIKATNLNLLHQGNVDKVDIADIYTGDSARIVKTSYTAEAFFQEPQPLISKNGVYTVMGVSFSEEEFQQTRVVMQAAADSIGAGIGKNANLDYTTYAQMGISLSAVKAYAEKNLNADQSAVVISAMEQYNNSLVNMEQKLFENGNYVSTDYEGLSDYYGIGLVQNEDDVKVFNDLIDEMNRLSGGNRQHMSAGTVSTVQSATNKGLINSISSLFSNLDLTNSSDVDAAMNQYKALMTPVYQTMGFRTSDGSLSRILDKNVSAFMTQIKDLMAASSYHSFNLSI